MRFVPGSIWFAWVDSAWKEFMEKRIPCGNDRQNCTGQCKCNYKGNSKINCTFRWEGAHGEAASLRE